MESHGESVGGATLLGALLSAVIEATGEGVVVFDSGGQVAYASPSAQGLLRGLSGSAATADQVVPRLIEHGGRRVPLQLGARALGEAIFLGSWGGEASLAARERRAILETLQATGWRLTATARNLGISRTTLWRRLRAYGLQRKP
jgi:transcriptional regulator of acetoin/glycerol metabolism